MKRTCKQCGIDFEIKESEINYYKSKNLEIPKRCPECRQENKSKNVNKVNDNISNINNSPNVSYAKFKYLIYGIICLVALIGFLVSEFVLKDEKETDKFDSNETEISELVDNVTEDISEFFGTVTKTEDKTEDKNENLDSSTEEITTEKEEIEVAEYRFRSKKLLTLHFEKHGIDMGFESAAEYEKAASAVITNPMALHKIEQEDGDDIYYVESTNEFVVVAKDGYIRTYFLPDKGIDYYNRQ